MRGMADDFNIELLIRSWIKEAVAETVAQLSRDGAAAKVKRRLLTVEEAATYLGRTEEAMQHLIAGRKIRTVRIDRRVFIDVNDLNKLIEDYKT
jgi:excisionase family DNA binding protein